MSNSKRFIIIIIASILLLFIIGAFFWVGMVADHFDTETGYIQTFLSLDKAQEHLKNLEVVEEFKLASVKDYFPETKGGAPHSLK